MANFHRTLRRYTGEELYSDFLFCIFLLETTFYLPNDGSNPAAPIHTEVLDIGRSDNFNFKVITCGLLQIGLRSTTDPSMFAALQVCSFNFNCLTCCRGQNKCDSEIEICF